MAEKQSDKSHAAEVNAAREFSAKVDYSKGRTLTLHSEVFVPLAQFVRKALVASTPSHVAENAITATHPKTTDARRINNLRRIEADDSVNAFARSICGEVAARLGELTTPSTTREIGQAEVRELARKAGFEIVGTEIVTPAVCSTLKMERFAALVASRSATPLTHRLPDGWNIWRTAHIVETFGVKSPEGHVAFVSAADRNPALVLYMLAKAMCTADGRESMMDPVLNALLEARRAWHRERGLSGESCPTNAMCEAFDKGFLARYAGPISASGSPLRIFAAPRHMPSILVFCDDKMPEGTAELRDHINGRVLCKLVNLGD